MGRTGSAESPARVAVHWRTQRVEKSALEGREHREGSQFGNWRLGGYRIYDPCQQPSRVETEARPPQWHYNGTSK